MSSPAGVRCFSTLGCGEHDLDGVMEIARLHRVPCVELRTLGGTVDLPAYLASRYGSPDGFAAAARAMQARIASLGTSLRMVDGSAPQLLRDRVQHVHVKDSVADPRAKDGYRYVVPGKGEFPMDRLREALAHDGFAGVLSLEWERFWHPELPPLDVALQAVAANAWW